MPYNHELASRVKSCLESLPEDFSEKEMFGGISFLYEGLMTVGVVKDELVVRVVEEKMEAVLLSPYVRPMDFSGKILREYIYVKKEGLKGQKSLLKWISLGLEHAKRKL